MKTHVTRTRRFLAVVVACGALAALAIAAGPASAAVSPWWRVSTTAAPTNLQPGGIGQLELTAVNVGDAEINATSSHVTVTDTLPAGLEATGATGAVGSLLFEESTDFEPGPVTCATQPTTVTCTFAGPKPLIPFVPVEVKIAVKVAANATSGEGHVAVAGGGTQAVSVPQRVTVGGETKFGVQGYELAAENEGGTSDVQAGRPPVPADDIDRPERELRQRRIWGAAIERDRIHPENGGAGKGPRGQASPGPGGQRDIATPVLGSGLHQGPGSGQRVPRRRRGRRGDGNVLEPEVSEFVPFGGVATATVPVFNLVPAPGEPARFGFDAYGNFVTLDTSVATGEDYAVLTSVGNVTEIASLLSSQVTLWGTPGDARHSRSRGWDCLDAIISPAECAPLAEPGAKAFLRLPTSCQALSSSVLVDSYREPGGRLADGAIDTSDPHWKGASSQTPPLQNCGNVPFSPSLSVQPETEAGSTPSGMSFDVHVPQTEHETPEGLGESDVRSTTVTLPPGVLLSPAAAHGLQACAEGQVGFTGFESFQSVSTAVFTPSLPEPFCPEASRVGNVRIKTPLLNHELEGGVYLATQDVNPFNSLVALYIVAKDPVSGVLVKLAGKATLDQSTGQVSTTFESTPQTPFEDFKLDFFGGPTANLTTPPYCGTHTTTASFVPWSGGETVKGEASFQTTSNCTNPGSNQPFSPSFQAGPTNSKAGAYSPFTLTLGNPDGDQALKSLTMHLAPGMAAMLSSVTPCPESQVVSNSCGADSLIGHSTAVSGLGSNPYALPGNVYLTGPYKGAPFGLSVVTPAVAGPFNLGDITVRSTINVDRNDASVTINSDPFPEFVQGIPSQLKQVNVIVDRPNFEFNPTNCGAMSVTGTLSGVQGGTKGVSAPIQLGGCSALPFKPTLTASTKGNASKVNGAELVVKVTSSPGQANIAKTKLVLPLTLPSRLTTIQKACLAAVFEANPAGCAEGSNIGTAVVHTPVLKEALSGPAYLVSHGNAAFPDVEFVLSNKEGIELILDGQTDIKKGITTSTFNAVPDAPVSIFEAKLPEGPHSALTSNVPESKHFSLCGQKMVIPTTITGQNGAVIQQETKVPVEGCNVLGTRHAKLSRAQKLKKALKACRKKFKHNKPKRASCEKQARKSFGPKKAHKKSGKKKK